MLTFAKQIQIIQGWQHLSQHVIGSEGIQEQMMSGKSGTCKAPKAAIYHMCHVIPTG